MTFTQAIQSGLKNYAKFDGRASRSEYWWFTLFTILVYFGGIIVIAIIAGILGAILPQTAQAVITGIISLVFFLGLLALIIPHLSLTFRRLHDINNSAWWLLIGFVPLVGSIVLLIFYCTPGTPGPNTFGPALGLGAAETFS